MANEITAFENKANTGTRTRRQRLQDFAKNEIFKAVVDAVERHGWSIISMEEIADELGGSKGTIYYYFKSKNDLIVAMWLHLHRQMTDVLLPICQDPALDAETRLAKYIRSYVRLICGHWRLSRAIWTNGLVIIKWDQGTGDALLKERKSVIRAIMKMIADLNPQARKHAKVLEARATALMHALESVSVWYREPDSLTADQIADMMTAMLMEGLRHHGSSKPQ